MADDDKEKRRSADGASTSLELSRAISKLTYTEPTIPQLPAPTLFDTPPTTAATTPIFVLGSGRSGTTLIGAYIGSSPAVLDLGEYFGFHLAHNVAQQECSLAPSPYRDAYLASVRQHARAFPSQIARATGQSYFCDSTPWNIESAASIAADVPEAIFVLLVRHYAGVVLSLEKSYETGRRWAGATWEQRAELWRRCYANARFLPRGRTVVVSYDGLCARPERTLEELHQRLAALGFPVETLNRASLAKQYTVVPGGKSTRRQIAVETEEGVIFQTVRSVDLERWTPDIEAAVLPIVQETSRSLAELYPDQYREDIH